MRGYLIVQTEVYDEPIGNANCCSNAIQDVPVWTAAECVTLWKQCDFSD